MTTAELRAEICEIQNGDLHERSVALYEWLKGDKQQVMIEMFELIALYHDLVNALTTPVNQDLRKPETEFYPMSKPATRRY